MVVVETYPLIADCSFQHLHSSHGRLPCTTLTGTVNDIILYTYLIMHYSILSSYCPKLIQDYLSQPIRLLKPKEMKF